MPTFLAGWAGAFDPQWGRRESAGARIGAMSDPHTGRRRCSPQQDSTLRWPPQALVRRFSSQLPTHPAPPRPRFRTDSTPPRTIGSHRRSTPGGLASGGVSHVHRSCFFVRVADRKGGRSSILAVLVFFVAGFSPCTAFFRAFFLVRVVPDVVCSPAYDRVRIHWQVAQGGIEGALRRTGALSGPVQCVRCDLAKRERSCTCALRMSRPE